MDLTYVEDFFESDGESDDEISEPKPKRMKRTPRIWRKIREFESKEEAEAHVNSKFMWKIASVKSSLEGTRKEYRCTAGQYRIRECPAGLYLLYHATSMNVSLFETECNHANHDFNPSRGLTNEMKNFIREKYKEGIQKPNALLGAIRRKNFPEPVKSKLIAFLKQLRHEKFGRSSVSVGDLRVWCDERTDIPADEDEPFVLDHMIHAESPDTDEQDLKIVISTKRLLSNLQKSAMVQIDATYKLIWQGYPVIVLGTSDKNKVFHPFGLAICKDETTDDFKFIFQAFHKFDVKWNPSILLADGSESITEGFQNTFGDPKVRITCFLHVLKNLEKYFKGLQKGGVGIKLKSDIHSLQTCADETSFLKATELFFIKWFDQNDRKVDEFLQYFQKEWILKRSNWYEGAAPGYPSTNNGIEATNSIIKREQILRERLPVGQFLSNIVLLIAKWSQTRDPKSVNCLQFAGAHSTSLAEWTAAYQWAMKNVKVLQLPHTDPDYIVFLTNSSSSKKEITPDNVSTYEDTMGKWATFEEFQHIYYGTWKIMLNINCLNKSKCSCPYFSQNLTCKHVLGMQIRLKLVHVPPEAKSVPGQKRKRGRPTKAVKALLIE